MGNDKCFCLACMEKFSPPPIRNFLEKKPILCDTCLEGVDSLIQEKTFAGTKILFLSGYSGNMKKWLLQYKEGLDVALSPCFLSPYLLLLRTYYFRSVFVPLPSSEKKNQERGFVHLEEILRSANLPFLSVLAKEEETEQKELGPSGRRDGKKMRLLPGTSSLSGKHIVLFDDVLTTGETFRKALALLKTLPVASIRGLVLMDNGDDWHRING